jgi:molybdate transport system substrate-binding protein
VAQEFRWDLFGNCRRSCPPHRAARIAQLFGLALLASLAGDGPTSAETLKVFGAGSLREVITEVAADFTRRTKIEVHGEFGPSGRMAARIERGEVVDVLTSADMGYPLKLQASGVSGPAVMFARSALCALADSSIGLTADNFVDRLLDPKIRIGTTAAPNVGPLGVYTSELLRRMDALRPGSSEILLKKMQQLPDASDANIVNGRRPEVPFFEQRQIDVAIAYCPTAREIARQVGGTEAVETPTALRVGPEYGLAIMKNAQASAPAFALHLLSVDGQKILARHGYLPVGLPE